MIRLITNRHCCTLLMLRVLNEACQAFTIQLVYLYVEIFSKCNTITLINSLSKPKPRSLT